MKVREKIEQREKQFLNRFATLSANSRGREKPEAECDMRTCFQRDRDRIIYSKSFRRLKNKTQVFFSPEGDHYITRLTHTLDVSQVARSIATTIKDDPTVLVSYCQDNNFFNPVKPTEFEEEEIAKIVWKNQDIIEAYKQKVGEPPTEDVVYEILDYLNIDSDGGLEDCSQGWDVINVAINEYLEAKK